MSNYILIKPDISYMQQIKEYREEFIKCGSSFDGTTDLKKYEDIEKWILETKLYESEETCPPLMSLAYQYLYIDEKSKQVVGMIQIRTKAMSHPFLREYGGHIGYSVLPSRRNEGIGSKMLKDCLSLCKNEYKLDKVLVTCLKSNEASRRIILSNKGIYEKDVFYKPENEYLERYWIEL